MLGIFSVPEKQVKTSYFDGPSLNAQSVGIRTC